MLWLLGIGILTIFCSALWIFAVNKYVMLPAILAILLVFLVSFGVYFSGKNEQGKPKFMQEPPDLCYVKDYSIQRPTKTQEGKIYLWIYTKGIYFPQSIVIPFDKKYLKQIKAYEKAKKQNKYLRLIFRKRGSGSGVSGRGTKGKKGPGGFGHGDDKGGFKILNPIEIMTK